MSDTSEDTRASRERMVEQLRWYGCHDERVIGAMGAMPREAFVPKAIRARAYEDGPLPIGHGQTISQPYMVAFMLEAMQLSPRDRVLDIGTGSGYQAALLGRLCREVWSVEIVRELSLSAERALAPFGASNVHLIVGDGSMGLPEQAPYDAIVVAAGSPSRPDALIAQLRPGGRLIVPVGDLNEQILRRYTRGTDGLHDVRVESLLPCRFVPLIGAAGWSAPDRLDAGSPTAT